MNEPTRSATEHLPATGSEVVSKELDPAVGSPYRHSVVTIPNIICAFRLVGSFVLLCIALKGNAHFFAGLFTALSLSDWIDGKLARWLNQRSEFGARLDSFADSMLYGALFFGLMWLKWDVLELEVVWWVSAFLSYLVTSTFGLWKFGRIPSYHTYGAKTTQWLILGGALGLLLDYSIWPFRIAMAGVTLTNIEATAMTWLLKKWRVDVLSILHVLPTREDEPKIESRERDPSSLA